MNLSEGNVPQRPDTGFAIGSLNGPPFHAGGFGDEQDDAFEPNSAGPSMRHMLGVNRRLRAINKAVTRVTVDVGARWHQALPPSVEGHDLAWSLIERPVRFFLNWRARTGLGC